MARIDLILFALSLVTTSLPLGVTYVAPGTMTQQAAPGRGHRSRASGSLKRIVSASFSRT
jgi:hypothetical protein